tara:strand:+ start:2716 stop:2883 length:168 start_codon:yes stop_codon:yes gene_type:complete
MNTDTQWKTAIQQADQEGYHTLANSLAWLYRQSWRNPDECSTEDIINIETEEIKT